MKLNKVIKSSSQSRRIVIIIRTLSGTNHASDALYNVCRV